jgi:coenzyme F420-0:L-glutamate ligase/coenzyme F420-1:gamma-L-glutamate ligase
MTAGARPQVRHGGAESGSHGLGASAEGPDSAALAAVVFARRSVRRYTAEPVARTDLRRLIELSACAPSNFNSQPWRFVVIDEPDARRRFVDTVEAALAKTRSRQTSVELFYVAEHIAAWLDPLRASPALILAFYRRNPEAISRGLSEIPGAGDVLDYNPNLLSLGMALENLMLGAQAAGLGACAMAGPVPFARGWINGAMGVPDVLELALVVTVGHPAETPPPPRRRDLHRVVTFADLADDGRWKRAP